MSAPATQGGNNQAESIQHRTIQQLLLSGNNLTAGQAYTHYHHNDEEDGNHYVCNHQQANINSNTRLITYDLDFLLVFDTVTMSLSCNFFRYYQLFPKIYLKRSHQLNIPLSEGVSNLSCMHWYSLISTCTPNMMCRISSPVPKTVEAPKF